MTAKELSLYHSRRIPLSEKPREKPKCPYHTSHVVEFTCLEPDCATAPLMCYICKDYGRHKNHQHNLLELEAEQVRRLQAGPTGPRRWEFAIRSFSFPFIPSFPFSLSFPFSFFLPL